MGAALRRRAGGRPARGGDPAPGAGAGAGDAPGVRGRADAGGPAVRAARALDPRRPRPGPDRDADHAGDADDADADADADDADDAADGLPVGVRGHSARLSMRWARTSR